MSVKRKVRLPPGGRMAKVWQNHKPQSNRAPARQACIKLRDFSLSIRRREGCGEEARPLVSPLLGPLPARSSQGEDGKLDAALTAHPRGDGLRISCQVGAAFQKQNSRNPIRRIQRSGCGRLQCRREVDALRERNSSDDSWCCVARAASARRRVRSEFIRGVNHFAADDRENGFDTLDAFLGNGKVVVGQRDQVRQLARSDSTFLAALAGKPTATLRVKPQRLLAAEASLVGIHRDSADRFARGEPIE